MNPTDPRHSGSQDPPKRGTSGAGADLQQQAERVGEHAAAEAKSRVDQQTNVAAERLDALADGARAAAERLDENENADLSHYVSGIARSMGELADGLRGKSADELMRDVTDIARRNPALFVTGAVAIGFGLTRFARASAQRSVGSERRVMAPQQRIPDRRGGGVSATDSGERAYAAPAAPAGGVGPRSYQSGAPRSGAELGYGADSSSLTTPSSGSSTPETPGSRQLPRSPGGKQP